MAGRGHSMKAVGGRAFSDKAEAKRNRRPVAKPGASDRAGRRHPARAGRRSGGLEPRPDRPAREPGALHGAADRRRARGGKISDRRFAERPGAAWTDHPAACRLGAHRFRRRGAALSDAAVERAQGDRRPLRGQEGSPGVHRSGDRLAAAAYRVRGRRDVSAVLHRERQGVSRQSRQRGDRRAHRHRATSSARRAR